MLLVRASGSIAVALVILLCAVVSAAQPARHPSVAQTLFDEGKRLMAKGQWAEACAKLDESNRLDPRSGTQINLAVCHEKEGKLATAWAEFHEALARAAVDKRPERKKLAEERLEAIEPRLPRLQIDVPEDALSLDDLAITIDGTPVGPAGFGVAHPFDPGEHRVVATASGRKTFESTVQLQEGRAETVVVELIVDETPPVEPAPPPEPIVQPLPVTTALPPIRDVSEIEEGRTQRLVGWALVGTGGGILAIATGLGIAAVVDARAANAVCTRTTCPDDESLAQNERARIEAHAATGTFVAGAAVGISGLVVALVAPAPQVGPPAVAVGPIRMRLEWSF